jgi:hypothetical protein
MLKLVTLAIVVGGLTLTGCSNATGPQDQVQLREQEGMGRTPRQPVRGPVSDSTRLAQAGDR